MRIIDADALIESVCHTADLGGWIGDTLRTIKRLAVRYINSAPTIDAVEVVHGEWIESEYQNDADVANGNYAYVCSNCHHTDIHAKTQSVPYCWYCGAKMDGERKDEQLGKDINVRSKDEPQTERSE